MSERVQTQPTLHGIEVTASPRYLADKSSPADNRYVFGYRITIANRGETRAKLLSRHWIIVDADGARHDVRGEGVIGRQPVIEPGAEFAYSSFCPLPTAWGTMEGEYVMERDGGEVFEVEIARFYLAGPTTP